MEESRVTWLIDFFKQLFKKIKDDDVQAISAQLTYYLLLSFFPFLIFIMTLVGYANISIVDKVDDLREIIPVQAVTIIEEIIKEVSEGRSQALLSFGMLATLWASSRCIKAIIKGLNKAYAIEDNRRLWKMRVFSLLGTFVIGIVVLLSILLIVFGNWVGNQLSYLFHFSDSIHHLWNFLQYMIPLIVMTIVFTLLYMLGPNQKVTFKEALPGATFTTLGWIITSVTFSIYVNQFGNFTKTYGSLGGVMILLIWLYISSNIILIGGEINATLSHRNRKTTLKFKK
ncbi:ribonuclease [Paenibacillus antarcticus]|uniref:Ribonuclease n=1 Tax=Paenibacillus antarcticus TaxID=253703 RepID=A0A162LV32_9BACL|nr:ribonuclease [Paenibacillus antarcticus]